MWHCLFVDNQAKANALSQQLFDEHFALLAVVRNMDAIILSRFDPETAGTYFYFSPGTEALARAHGGIQCEKPSRQDAGGIISGDQTAVSRLYG